MSDYAYNKIYEEVVNDWENYGFDSQDEAIKWLREHLIGYGFQTVSFEDEVKKSFQDGAEYGYNKANEWHYVKDGDLPKNDMQVLVLLKNKRMKISIFMESKFTVWNKDYDTYTKLYNVIVWKEIVPPKEVEE